MVAEGYATAALCHTGARTATIRPSALTSRAPARPNPGPPSIQSRDRRPHAAAEHKHRGALAQGRPLVRCSSGSSA
eukprot:15461733-Alexandrium_andersonii.AAC.1